MAGEPVPENPDPVRLVWIPPGAFTMGSPTNEAERNANYEVQHRVTLLHGFYLFKYLATQEDYLAALGTNPSYWLGDTKRPVEQVSWYEAVNFCGLLTQQEEAAGRLPPGWVYRLPTEAEWEYACRAGISNAFYFGHTLLGGMYNFDSHYEYDISTGEAHISSPTMFVGQTTPVGSYPANPWGLFDMCGNAWEWCQDWYAPYPAGNATNPGGPASGTQRVVRGGSWISHGFRCRSAARYSITPDHHGYNVGFRPVLAPRTDIGPPVILAQPQPVTVPAGADATFSVVAVGSPLSYRWRFNDTDIPGATNSACVLTNVSFDDAGSYSVVITNIDGFTNSDAAMLTVRRTWKSGLDLRYSDGTTIVPYRLYLPKEYDPGTPYPLVIFFHGAGEIGTNNISQVNTHIAGLIDRTYSDYPAILVAPQINGGPCSWSPRCPTDLTLGILAQVRQNYSVDERRIYLTGLSMGGFGTTEYASWFPTVFAAIAPMSGTATIPPSAGTPLSRVPTWLFHGSADSIVPVSVSRDYFTNVTGLATISFTETNYGYPTAVSEPIRYTEFTGRGHAIWDLIYGATNADLYDWMFAQTRPAAAVSLTLASASGSTVILNAYGDVPFATGYLLTATNLLTPRSQWVCLATNWFDATGSLTFNLEPDGSQRFFTLKSP